MRVGNGIAGMTLIACMVFAFAVEATAQPDRRGGRGRGGRGGGARLRMMLPLEQTLGFLAFDEKLALKDNQLIKIRSELKDIHEKRAELEKEMRSGADRQQLMQKLGGIRGSMFEKIKAVLDDRQDKILDRYLERLRRGFQRGRGGGRRGGGPSRRRRLTRSFSAMIDDTAAPGGGRRFLTDSGIHSGAAVLLHQTVGNRGCRRLVPGRYLTNQLEAMRH